MASHDWKIGDRFRRVKPCDHGACTAPEHRVGLEGTVIHVTHPPGCPPVILHYLLEGVTDNALRKSLWSNEVEFVGTTIKSEPAPTITLDPGPQAKLIHHREKLRISVIEVRQAKVRPFHHVAAKIAIRGEESGALFFCDWVADHDTFTLSFPDIEVQ